MERLLREPDVRSVGLHHPDGVTEAASELCRPAGMELERDDPDVRVHERGGEGTAARSDVEHQRAAGQVGLSDESARPVFVEFVPPPGPVRPSHGDAPSPSAWLQPTTAAGRAQASFRA